MVDVGPFGAQVCLHRLIETQAARTPDRTALVFEEQALSYRELDRRANELAHLLVKEGVAAETVVALCVERSLDAVVGMLGITKAGAAYLPIDAAFPPERIAFMLGDANAAVLLTHSSLLAGLPAGAGRIVCLDTIDWGGADGPPAVAVGEENLAYVIYTSGSTGRPKGVCIEHRNIVNYVLGIIERLQLSADLNYATVSTLAADLGNTVIFPALATGGCLHVISRERAENSAMLADYFRRTPIDVLKIVPSHLAALQSGPNPEEIMPRRCLILGGEASQLGWAARLRTLAPHCEIYNHYGPTETTVGVLTYHLGPEMPATASGTLPLGRPLPGSRVHLLDADGRPVTDGEQGELYIGGLGVARGYLNCPDLTAERFVPDPLSADGGGRLYRSGDLARCLPDGNIEFCGRVDDQVKVHGYRIELGEINGALREHGGVRDVAVLAREDASGSVQLAAYVVPKQHRQALWACQEVHVLPDGAPVAHLDKSESEYLYDKIFVRQAYLRHGITLADGDCVVDVGANIGLFTVFASRLARDLRVLAFEPNPAAFACLQVNAEAWGAQVKCLPLGLSNRNRMAELTTFEGSSLLSGFYPDAAAERGAVRSHVLARKPEAADDERLDAEIGALIDEQAKARMVSAQVRTLASVMAEHGVERIDLLKINVKRGELDILMGLRDDDWSRIHQIVIEADRHTGLAAITALLERQGYDLIIDQDRSGRSELQYVYAVRPTAARPRLARQQAADKHLRVPPPPPEEILTRTTLRRHLARRLPGYMIPSAFVLLEQLPLTINGKLDRQALPPVSHDRLRGAATHAGPRTETEQALAAIWSEVLKIDSIGIDDDFFDMGGQSLTAMRVVVRIRDRFAVDLSLRSLFERPTVAGLAGMIDELSWLAKGRIASGAPLQGASSREEIAL